MHVAQLPDDLRVPTLHRRGLRAPDQDRGCRHHRHHVHHHHGRFPDRFADLRPDLRQDAHAQGTSHHRLAAVRDWHRDAVDHAERHGHVPVCGHRRLRLRRVLGHRPGTQRRRVAEQGRGR